MTEKLFPDNDESFCLEQLGISNARGKVAGKLREMTPPAKEEELLTRPLSQGRYLVVDLETTGMKPGAARIIEIGAVEVDGFSIGRELASLVYPGTQVPPFITSLTGIKNSMVIKAPRLIEVLPMLERMMKGRVLVAHNVSFDRSFLKDAWEKVLDKPLVGPSLCTVKLSRRTFPELGSHNLDSLAQRLRIRPESRGARARHRALGDARLTAIALIRICRRLEREGMGSIGELMAFQKKRRKPGNLSVGP